MSDGKGDGKGDDRPRQSDFERLVAAGWDLFSAKGVDQVGLDAIASAAGVPQATLFEYFTGKNALFEAGIAREMKRIEAAQVAAWDFFSPDLGTTLRQFGYGVAAFLVSQPAVSSYTVLAGELQKTPELARRFYETGPGRTRENLSRIIARAAERGEIVANDPAEAAEHLFGMWQGFSNFQLALRTLDAPDATTLARRVDRAVEVFLKAYDYRRGGRRAREEGG